MDILSYMDARREQMAAFVRALVEIESPSGNRAAVNQVSAFLKPRFEQLGARVTIHPQTVFGDHFQADFAGEGKPILLLGHIDTVWDVGTLKTMPCELKEGRLHGPGSFDMKAGVVLMWHALEYLRNPAGAPLKRGAAELGWEGRPVTVLLVTDEEVGSDSSRPITEKVARECSAVLVVEPSGKDGACKTARKGVGEYTIKVTGVASHAGLDFEKGQSAITELAHQVLAITGFTDVAQGITVNPGTIRGGSRRNVVAPEAEAGVDVRVVRMDQAPGLDQRFRALRPVNPKCKVEVEGGVNRPPLERTEHVARLYGMAREIAAEFGKDLKEIAVGGGSDGNFTAGLGIPTLDGLGPVGDGAHAAHEHITVADLPWRAALLAGLVEKL